jgi:hypothetical protein
MTISPQCAANRKARSTAAARTSLDFFDRLGKIIEGKCDYKLAEMWRLFGFIKARALL